MVARLSRIALAGALAALAVPLAVPATAQLANGSPGYQFRDAVKNEKGQEMIALLAKPGNRLINSQDPLTGEAALHIVVKRGDSKYLSFLLEQDDVDPNIKDAQGNTPLMYAVRGGYEGLVLLLLKAKANPNIANNDGDIPLMLAVTQRDVSMVRDLLSGGADPDKTDRAGRSPRDIAAGNAARDPVMASLFDAIPKKSRRPVSGPTLR